MTQDPTSPTGHDDTPAPGPDPVDEPSSDGAHDGGSPGDAAFEAELAPAGPAPAGPALPPYAGPTSGPYPTHAMAPTHVGGPVPPGAVVVPPKNHADRRGVPGWTWPALAALSLMVGLVGGALGAGLQDRLDTTSLGLGSSGARTAPPLADGNESVAAVAGELLPSTVQILATGSDDAGGTGSGFVLDARGHVVTNNHVVDSAADSGTIQIVDYEGKVHEAEVIGRSRVYDLAVLRAKGVESLTPASLGASEDLLVGDAVVAFGAPLGLSQTVTSGIVSAKNRPVTTGASADESSFINAVQTDAAINPGNSGGPLVNLAGQVVGVNSAIATTGGLMQEAGNIGVGFAIPIEQVKVTADQILRTGEARYPVIGARVETNGRNDLSGAVIEQVMDGTPASRAGLRDGDVVVALDGVRVTDGIALIVQIRTRQPGDTISLTVRRGDDRQSLDVTLGSEVG